MAELVDLIVATVPTGKASQRFDLPDLLCSFEGEQEGIDLLAVLIEEESPRQ